VALVVPVHGGIKSKALPTYFQIVNKMIPELTRLTFPLIVDEIAKPSENLLAPAGASLCAISLPVRIRAESESGTPND
jgi:hypothetical protein